MKGDRHYILRWLSGILMLLLLTACSGSSSEGGNEPVPVPSNPVPTPDKPVLKIYIFPPNHPTITRAGDLGNVDASEEENKIHSLHVWVFDRDESNLPSSLSNSKLVGYVSLGNLTLSDATRPIRAGFVLQEGDVEVNCALETLAELSRADLAGQVAAVLFD